MLYAHTRDERWISMPGIWPPGAPLLAAGPGWDPERLPDTAGYTNDLAGALRAVQRLTPG